jgi:hypothetical protein
VRFVRQRAKLALDFRCPGFLGDIGRLLGLGLLAG